MEAFIPTESKMEELLDRVIDRKFDERLHQLKGATSQKKFLSTRDIRDSYGLSYRAQQHHRDEGNIEFVQDGRKVLYPVEAVEKFFSERRVKASSE